MSGSSAITLKMLLLAQDQASKTLKSVGGHVDDTGKKVGGLSTKTKLAMAGAGVAILGFATSSINKFQQVTLESRQLQRAMGGTLESASRFREAAILSGVDAGTFTKSMQKLDKTLVGATSSQTKTAAMAKTLGIAFTDAHGKVLPMSQLLPQISDRFAKMPDGAQKTALAMQLFGKSGNSMLPFLSKGSAGIAELMKQSDKFGTTLNSNAIDSLSKAREQSRQFTAGLDGLKVQIGAQLLPIMNKLIGFIQNVIIPIFQKVSAFVREHKNLVMFLAIAIGTLVVAWKLWTAAAALWNAVMDANPIMLIVIALAALAAGFIYAWKHSETFRNIIKDVFHVVAAVGKWMWNNVLRPVFDALKTAWHVVATVIKFNWDNIIHPVITAIVTVFRFLWNGVIQPISHAISTAFHAIGTAIKWVWDNIIGRVFGWIKDGIRGVRDVIRAVVSVISNIFKGIGNGLKWAYDHVVKPIASAIMSVINGVKDAISWITNLDPKFSGSITKGITKAAGGTQLPGSITGSHPRAGGGRVRAGMPYIVGEYRPELFVPDVNGNILPRVPTGAGSAGAAGGAVALDTTRIEQRLDAILRELGRGGDVYIDGYKAGHVEGRQADRYSRAG